MTQEELDELFRGLTEQGWNPRLCDLELPHFDNKVSCGKPTGIGDVMRKTKRLPDGAVVNPEFTVDVVGDSMKEAGIEDGDTVIVSGNTSYEDGDAVLAIVDGEYMIKTFYIDEDGTPWLMPENDDYLDCAMKVTEDVWITGVVSGKIKKQPRASYRSCKSRLERIKKMEEEPQVDPRELMAQAVEKTIKAGLWASDTCWSVVYAVFREKGFPGTYADFIHDVDSWKFTTPPTFKCNKDSVSRPFRDRKMMAPVCDWEGRGVKKGFCLLGEKLLEEMKDYKKRSIPLRM